MEGYPLEESDEIKCVKDSTERVKSEDLIFP